MLVIRLQVVTHPIHHTHNERIPTTQELCIENLTFLIELYQFKRNIIKLAKKQNKHIKNDNNSNRPSLVGFGKKSESKSQSHSHLRIALPMLSHSNSDPNNVNSNNPTNTSSLNNNDLNGHLNKNPNHNTNSSHKVSKMKKGTKSVNNKNVITKQSTQTDNMEKNSSEEKMKHVVITTGPHHEMYQYDAQNNLSIFKVKPRNNININGSPLTITESASPINNNHQSNTNIDRRNGTPQEQLLQDHVQENLSNLHQSVSPSTQASTQAGSLPGSPQNSVEQIERVNTDDTEKNDNKPDDNGNDGDGKDGNDGNDGNDGVTITPASGPIPTPPIISVATSVPKPFMTRKETLSVEHLRDHFAQNSLSMVSIPSGSFNQSQNEMESMNDDNINSQVNETPNMTPNMTPNNDIDHDDNGNSGVNNDNNSNNNDASLPDETEMSRSASHSQSQHSDSVSHSHSHSHSISRSHSQSQSRSMSFSLSLSASMSQLTLQARSKRFERVLIRLPWTRLPIANTILLHKMDTFQTAINIFDKYVAINASQAINISSGARSSVQYLFNILVQWKDKVCYFVLCTII